MTGPSQLRTHLALGIRAGRRLLDIDQRELARRAGLSKSAIGRLEAEVANPTLDTVERALRPLRFRLALATPDGLWQPAVEAIEGDLEWACDRSGRRPPAHWFEERIRGQPHWRISRQLARNGPSLGNDQPWTYHRSRLLAAAYSEAEDYRQELQRSAGSPGDDRRPDAPQPPDGRQG